MLKKFLKESLEVVIGKQVEGLVDLLDTKKYINEFVIAKKLGVTINQARNILYKISDNGLVSSMRKKDKKKGWFTYFWRLELLRSLEFLRGTFIKKIEQINSQIKSRETKEFYICERCDIEVTEENALLHDFTCSECGQVYARKDNTKALKELRKNLVKLKRDVELIDEEIKKEKEKIEKVKSRELRKKAKELQKSKKIIKLKKIKKKPLKTKQKKNLRRFSKKTKSIKKGKKK